MTKELLMKAVSSLPDEFHIDELFEEIVLWEKIEAGLRSLREGKGIPHEKVKGRMQAYMKQYRESHGRGNDNLVA